MNYFGNMTHSLFQWQCRVNEEVTNATYQPEPICPQKCTNSLVIIIYEFLHNSTLSLQPPQFARKQDICRIYTWFIDEAYVLYGGNINL